MPDLKSHKSASLVSITPWDILSKKVKQKTFLNEIDVNVETSEEVYLTDHTAAIFC